jgi:4-amino-4-deoxy-L-arabinose transferase-like glycosyltransferase
MEQTATQQRGTLHRRLIGAGIFLAAAFAVFVLMAREGQLTRATFYGLLLMLLAAGGLLSALGVTGDDDGDDIRLSQTSWGPLPGEPRWCAPLYTAPAALALVLVPALALGPATLPAAIIAALLPLSVPAVRRPGLLVFVVVSAIYLPLLGVYGLWDPWETHYGEVTREILSRDDWISLWWAQDGWFWSKPILIFWSEALTWHATALGYRPDAVSFHVEWVLRAPIFLMATGALLSLYAVISRVFTRRAAVISALVLATTPHFFFQAHQAITDMPFVSNMTMAVSMLLLAVTEDPERTVRRYRLGPLTVSARHAVIAALVVLVLPQVLYLVSRNVTLIDGPLFAWHPDQFTSGSAGNDHLPGNAPARSSAPVFRAVGYQPLSQAALWLLGLGALLWFLRKERRAQSLYMFAFYIFCALAFMAKGIPGFALPGLVALLYLVSCNRWSLMFQGRLRIAAGVLTIAVVAMPWFVAMYIRHGAAFTNRLLIHDHINRLASGVHGDKAGIEYFVAQLGYGMFPWIALVPAALAVWFYWRGSDSPGSPVERRRRETITVLSLWFAATFTLFSAMITKFHHYIFPSVPPAAVLIGLTVDRMLGEGAGTGSLRRNVLGALFAVAAAALCVAGVAGYFGDVRGVLPGGLKMGVRDTWVFEHRWHFLLCLVTAGTGVVFALVSDRLMRGPAATRAGPASSAPWHVSLGAALFAGAVVCAFVGRDISWTTAARPAGYERLIHLFVYNYKRPWPEQFDYRPILTGFAVVTTVLVLAAAWQSLRPTATRTLLGVGVVFALWCVDIYMIDLSPHWGQRELVERYYRERKSAAEPLVAWQMNWKGENLYSGNRIAVFTDLKNDKVKSWMEKNEGQRAFFILEHSRLGRFRSLLSGKTVRELTTKRECNKFLLVSARL